MDLLEKLKMVRDEINLLIEAEERKRGYQSEVGKRFCDRIKGMERKEVDSGFTINGSDLKLVMNRTRKGGDTQIEKIF